MDINFIGRPKPNRKWLEDVVALLDNEIIHMHQSVEHGPILLVWMLANFQITELSDENEKFRKYRQFGVRAVRLGVFGYLRAIVSHPMFRVSKCIKLQRKGNKTIISVL